MRMNETSCSSLAVVSKKLGDFVPVLVPLPELVQVPDLTIIDSNFLAQKDIVLATENVSKNLVFITKKGTKLGSLNEMSPKFGSCKK